MSIDTTSSRNNAIGTGSVDTYPYGYLIFKETHLKVTTKDAVTNVETSLAWPTDFSVAGVKDPNGGTITLTAGDLPLNDTITIRRVVAELQETQFRNVGGFKPEVHEDTFDFSRMVDQQLTDELARSLKLSETTDPSTVSTILPPPVAGEMFRWNALADALEGFTAVDIGNLLLVGINGFMVRTGPEEATGRLIVAGAGGVTINNGDGQSGNCSIDIDPTALDETNLAAGLHLIETGVVFPGSPTTDALFWKTDFAEGGQLFRYNGTNWVVPASGFTAAAGATIAVNHILKIDTGFSKSVETNTSSADDSRAIGASTENRTAGQVTRVASASIAKLTADGSITLGAHLRPSVTTAGEVAEIGVADINSAYPPSCGIALQSASNGNLFNAYIFPAAVSVIGTNKAAAMTGAATLPTAANPFLTKADVVILSDVPFYGEFGTEEKAAGSFEQYGDKIRVAVTPDFEASATKRVRMAINGGTRSNGNDGHFRLIVDGASGTHTGTDINYGSGWARIDVNEVLTITPFNEGGLKFYEMWMEGHGGGGQASLGDIPLNLGTGAAAVYRQGQKLFLGA